MPVDADATREGRATVRPDRFAAFPPQPISTVPEPARQRRAGRRRAMQIAL